MVKPATVTLAIACALPSLSMARDLCTNNLAYCGYNLHKKKHDYNMDMYNENKRVGAPTNAPAIWSTLYRCGFGGDGWIVYLDYCKNGCYDGGAGKSDYC